MAVSVEVGGREIDLRRLLAYVTDLELGVDRLRQHNRVVHQEVRGSLDHLLDLCKYNQDSAGPPAAFVEIGRAAAHLSEVMQDLKEPTGYHPSHDQVIAVAIRPLVQLVFRLQQRIHRLTGVELQLELETDYVDWFPGRLRHILDNLISNAIQYRDPRQTNPWVRVSVRASPQGYELKVSDNGKGISVDGRSHILDLHYRAAPVREAGLGVGLAVVKFLVEQSCGTLKVDSELGQGTTIIVMLPRFDREDYLL